MQHDAEHDLTAVLIDRHPMWLDILERTLESIGIKVVGQAASTSEGLTLVEELKPDVLVIDVETVDPDPNAPDVATCVRLARERVPSLKALVFSGRQDQGAIDAALAAGASAYVFKTSEPDDFATAIRQMFNRSLYFAKASTRAVRASPAVKQTGLTRRELEVLRLLAEGHSNAELARILWVTEQTVKFHLSNIYRKLNVSNRTGAARWAQLHGLLSRD